MKPNAIMTVRVLKRLKAAVGYHELGMTQQALHCLDGLAQMDKDGVFHLVTDILRDEFVKHHELEISAAKALETVAGMVPSRERRAIRMALSACYGKAGTGRAVAETAPAARSE